MAQEDLVDYSDEEVPRSIEGLIGVASGFAFFFPLIFPNIHSIFLVFFFFLFGYF